MRLGSQELWNQRPVLLVQAIWDRVIAYAPRQKLREAIGHARVLKIPAGHTTAILHIFWIKRKVAKFFEETLK